MSHRARSSSLVAGVRLLAAVQRLGNLAAGAAAGLLWTLASPRVAFGYLVAWMLLAVVGLLMTRRKSA